MGWLGPMPAATAAEDKGEFEDSLFAFGVTSEGAASSSTMGVHPAGSWVGSCLPTGDLLDTSVLAAGACILSLAVVPIPWKKLAGAVGRDGAVSGRPMCLSTLPGSSAEVTACGGITVVLFLSSLFLIFFTHSSLEFAQISLNFTVINMVPCFLQ